MIISIFIMMVVIMAKKGKPEWLKEKPPEKFDATYVERCFYDFYEKIKHKTHKLKVVGKLRRHGGTKKIGDKYEVVDLIEIVIIPHTGFQLFLKELQDKNVISKVESKTKDLIKMYTYSNDCIIYLCNEKNFVSQAIRYTLSPKAVKRLEGQAIFYDSEILWEDGEVLNFKTNDVTPITSMKELFGMFGIDKVFYK